MVEEEVDWEENVCTEGAGKNRPGCCMGCIGTKCCALLGLEKRAGVGGAPLDVGDSAFALTLMDFQLLLGVLLSNLGNCVAIPHVLSKKCNQKNRTKIITTSRRWPYRSLVIVVTVKKEKKKKKKETDQSPIQNQTFGFLWVRILIVVFSSCGSRY